MRGISLERGQGLWEKGVGEGEEEGMSTGGEWEGVRGEREEGTLPGPALAGEGKARVRVRVRVRRANSAGADSPMPGGPCILPMPQCLSAPFELRRPLPMLSSLLLSLLHLVLQPPLVLPLPLLWPLLHLLMLLHVPVWL